MNLSCGIIGVINFYFWKKLQVYNIFNVKHMDAEEVVC